jgi:hypothetical protein
LPLLLPVNEFFAVANFMRFALGNRVEGSTTVSGAGRFLVNPSSVWASTLRFFFLPFLCFFPGVMDDGATGCTVITLLLEANMSSISDFGMSV